jgi:hypothetical protein
MDTHVARPIAIVGLAGIALIHLLDAHDTFVSTPYKGWLYLGLIAGSLGAAALLARRDDPRGWAAAGILSVGALVAFVYSRTVGLPQSADDIGNWWEPLGLASLFVEGCVAALSAAVLLQYEAWNTTSSLSGTQAATPTRDSRRSRIPASRPSRWSATS